MVKKKTTKKAVPGFNPDDTKGIVTGDQEIVEMRSDIAVVTHDVKELVISDDEKEAYASTIRSKIKALQKKLKARLEFFIGPANTFVRSMRAIFRSYTGELDDMDDGLEKKMVAFHDIKEAQAKKEAERLEKENEKRIKKGKPPAPASVDPVHKAVRTEEGQTSYSKKWTYKILEEVKVPREFCTPVGKLLQDAVDEGQRKIAGCDIYQKTLTRRG